MNPAEVARLVESLLFVSPEPLDLAQIARVLDVPRETVEAGLSLLSADAPRRGIHVQRLGDLLQLVSAPEAAPYIERLRGSEGVAKLSTAAMETLAIVAYQQPVTRARIEAIRGVNSDRALATLQARGLIAEVGRLETAGRPALFGTTFEFLQHFGLHDLGDLPPLPEDLEMLIEAPDSPNDSS
jgi:segregation and condensation protein B